MKGRGRQEPPDRSHQLFVRHGTERPGPSALGRLRLVAMAVDGRLPYAPDPRHPLQAVDLVRRGRDPPAHHLDLRGAKGRLVSSRAIFASSSSLAIVRSPTFVLRRPISASRASAGRVFNDTSPTAKKASSNRSDQRLSPPGSATAVPDTHPVAGSARYPGCAGPTSALRRGPALRQRAGRAPTSARPSQCLRPSPHLLAVLYLQSGFSKNRRPGELRRGPRQSRRRFEH